MILRFAFAVVLALFGLSCHSRPVTLPSVGEVREALAQREKKLASFRYHGVATADSRRDEFDVAFRAPNRLLARLRREGSPATTLTVAFDGHHLYRVDHAAHAFEQYELELSPAKAALFLAETLMPFVPDGYRSPLVPTQNVSVVPIDQPACIGLRVEAPDGVTVTYVLRWPSADLLEKRTTRGALLTRYSTEHERCDEPLHVCVPQSLVERSDGKVVASTSLTDIDLHAEVPSEQFSLVPPEHYRVEHHVVSEPP